MPRRINWRRIRKHRNYTVDDVHRLLGVSKGTVRRWIKDGLPALTECKPFLIIGHDLIAFLKRRALPKQKCDLDQCYCFSCREPRRAAFGEVEFFPLNTTSGNLRALCETCSTVMHKSISMANLADMRTVFNVSIRQADRSLRGSQDPSLNDHLPREPDAHA